jgi:hypothetical protein
MREGSLNSKAKQHHHHHHDNDEDNEDDNDAPLARPVAFFFQTKWKPNASSGSSIESWEWLQ